MRRTYVYVTHKRHVISHQNRKFRIA